MRLRAPLAFGLALISSACGPTSMEPEWPPLAKKWFDRGTASFEVVDIDDAHVAAQNALRLEPKREVVRLLAARVALARLEFDQAIRHLDGITSTEARSIRGRAYWYSGRVVEAADELDALLADPEVRDPWAQEVGRLARLGTGRKPFAMSGGLVGVADMPPGTGALIVPLELNGDPVLGLVATGTPEVVVDSSGGRESAWVSLRFGERIEVQDVPALTKDLSGISRQLNVPIKLLLGVNLLRHVRPTIDYRGGQFVVRTFEPPPPPVSTTIDLAYVRGGGMVFRSALGSEDDSKKVSLLVDTSMQYPIAFDDGGFDKAGIDLSSLRPVPGGPGLKHAVLPQIHLGSFAIPDVPAVHGAPLEDYEKGLEVDLDGMLGAGLFGHFRVTLVDAGRTMWLEDAPLMAPRPSPAAPPSAPAPEGPPPPAG